MVEVKVINRDQYNDAIVISGLNFTEEDVKDLKIDTPAELATVKKDGLVIAFNPFTKQIYISMETDFNKNAYIEYLKNK